MFIVRFIIVIAELIVCYIFQTAVWTGLTINNAVPDLMMIVVVAIAHIKGSNAGIIYGFCAGMLMDLTYGKHLGYYALIYMFCGFLCGLLQRFFRKDDNVSPLILCGTAVFLSQSILYVSEFLMRGRLKFGFYFGNIILPKMVYTVLISAVLYKLIQFSILWSIRYEKRDVKNYD